MTTCSDTLLDDLSLDFFRIVDQFVEIIDIANELLAHARLQSLLLVNQRINRIAMVSELVQRNHYVFVVHAAATVQPLSYRSNAKTLIRCCIGRVNEPGLIKIVRDRYHRIDIIPNQNVIVAALVTWRAGNWREIGIANQELKQ